MRLGLNLAVAAPAVSLEPSTPANIPSVSAFWRADQGVTGTTQVSEWSPRKGPAAFTQVTGTKQPALTENVFGLHPSLRFDGTSDGMVGPTTGQLVTATEGTIYVLVRPISIALNDATIYFNDTVITDDGGYFGIHLRTGSPRVACFNYDGTADTTADASVTLGAPYVVRWRHSGGNIYQRVGSASESAPVASGATQVTTRPTHIGMGYTGTSYFANVDIGAVVTASAALSSDEDAAIMAWLNWYRS